MSEIAFQELHCFVAVAEELNFSRAAKRLHLSQPPLSRHIQALESKLGLRLLRRTTRSVSLTPAGALYLEDVRAVLSRLDEAGAAARRAGAGEVARLRLAFIGALLDRELVRVLQAFRRLRPECQIHLSDLSPADQLEGLQRGTLDGAFIGAAPQRLNGKLSLAVWKREPLLLALPQEHPMAHKKRLAFASLKAESWVMVSRAAAAAFRQQFDGLCAKAGFRPHVVQESERAAAVVTMVAAGQGISLLPRALSRLLYPGVVFRAVKGEQPQLEHAFVYGRAGCGVMPEFLQVLRGNEAAGTKSVKGPVTDR